MDENPYKAPVERPAPVTANNRTRNRRIGMVICVATIVGLNLGTRWTTHGFVSNTTQNLCLIIGIAAGVAYMYATGVFKADQSA